MGDNCSRFLNMCFESIKECEKIIFCWGEEDKETLNKFNEWKNKYPEKFELISIKYDQNNLGQNGITRNFYLNYLKEHYPNDFCLCLDADEVVDDLNKVKEFIQTAIPAVYAVKMRHFQQDLGHEDATQDIHFVPQRLFKISEADYYPETEHPVLQSKFRKNIPILNQVNLTTVKHMEKDDEFAYIGQTSCITIWHMAYIPNLWDIKKRYENHLKKSNMHSPEFLHWWYHNHIFGSYPKKEINKEDIPKVILDEFGIDKDEIYFSKRNIDIKHPLIVQQWYNHFKPESVLDLGCGRGCYLYFWRWFVEDSCGIELSKWAVEHAYTNQIVVGDISNEEIFKPKVDWDLITAIDVLEHLDDEQLDRTLKNMSKNGKKFIFSIPFDKDEETGESADANLFLDSTHKQFKSRTQWKKLIKSYGINIAEAPKHWYYSNQILIGIK